MRTLLVEHATLNERAPAVKMAARRAARRFACIEDAALG